VITYNINFTDSSKSTIQVEEKGLNEDFSVNFPGRIKLEWGEDVNENLLHLLEHFAVEAENLNINIPDAASSGNKLINPVEGQLWFNKSNNRLYVYVGEEWIPHAECGQQYGANWGQINHGEQLPLPISPKGYNFSYDECIWSVSPFTYFEGFEYVQCFSDIIDSTVTMLYQNSLGTVVEGVANYLIIGIRGNGNLGSFTPPLTPPSPTPSNTPDPTPSNTPSNTPDPTPSNTPDPTPTPTPSQSMGSTPPPSPPPPPSPTPSQSMGSTPPPSPPPSPSPTPSQSVGSTPQPTPSNTPDPTPSNTPDPTPSNTPDPTPDPTPSNSALEPLTASNDSDFGFSICPNDAPAASGSITVSGGSGDFTITAGSCVPDSSNLGSSPCSAVSVSASTGSASLPSVSSSLCPDTAARSLTQNFTVTDNVTGETASASVFLTQEVSASS